MIATVLAALLALPTAPPLQPAAPPLQEEGEREDAADERPDPERVKAAVLALETALEADEPATRERALAEHGEVAAEAVVELVERALRDAEVLVQAAALEALRWNRHPSAVATLERTYKRGKKLKETPSLYEALVRALGQHGQPSSLRYLADSSFPSDPPQVVNARIYSIGNVRTEGSIEALVDAMKKYGIGGGGRGGGGGGGRGGNNMNRHMDAVRVALTVLTGTDRGATAGEWLAWWNDAKGRVRVYEDLPEELPGNMRQRWLRYWGLDAKGERRKSGEDGDAGDDEGEEGPRRRRDGEGEEGPPRRRGGEGGSGSRSGEPTAPSAAPTTAPTTAPSAAVATPGPRTHR